MKPIIAITGKARHGKDSLYKAVLAPEGYNRVALADPVKGAYLSIQVVDRILGSLIADKDDAVPIPVGVLKQVFNQARILQTATQLYYGVFGATKDADTRHDLQYLGTEFARNQIDPYFWVWLALKEIRQIVYGRGERVAVTDCRFPNEAAALRGDLEAIRADYADMLEREVACQKQILSDLSATWDEGGLLPPAGMGLVVKVVRTSEGETLSVAAQGHASEVMVDRVNPDVTIEAADLEELQWKGRVSLGFTARGLEPGRMTEAELETIKAARKAHYPGGTAQTDAPDPLD